MKYTRLLASVAAVGMSAAVVALAAPAHAANPTYLTNLDFGRAFSSQAYNLSAAGGAANIAPTLNSSCGYASAQAHQQALLTSSAATVKATVSNCAVYSDFTAFASQSAATVTVLAGRIRLTAVHSTCSVDSFGVGRVGSTVGTLNGRPLSRGSGQVLKIPGLATVIINENTESPGVMTTSAVRINVLAVFVGGHMVTPSQVIVVGQCSVRTLT